MVAPVELFGANGKAVKVNDNGELEVALGPYDETEFKLLDVANTAYNFYKPKTGERFVLTGFLAYGDKDVNNASDSTVVIYEASAPDTTTVDKVLFQFEVGQNAALPFPNIKVLVNKGVYINAKTVDDDVHLTIVGHYIEAHRHE